MYCSQTIMTYNHIERKHKKAKKISKLTIICVVSICLILLLTPAFAFAYPFPFPGLEIWKIGDYLMGTLNATFVSGINQSFYNLCISCLNDKIIDTSFLTADWNNILKGQEVFNFLSNVSNVVIKPISGTILSIVCLMQLIKLSSKADSQGTLPVVKEVFFLVLFIGIFCFVISHAFEICGAIYQCVAYICQQIKSMGGSFPTPTQDFIHVNDWSKWEEFLDLDLGNLLTTWLFFGLANIVGWGASIIGIVMIIARGIQLYIYAAFSPIPMSLLGFDETKSWGVGFFKSFAGVAFAGALLLIIIFAMPFLMSSIFAGTDISQSIIEISAFKTGAGASSPAYQAGAKALGCVIVFIMGMLKSGSWAKEIMGG